MNSQIGQEGTGFGFRLRPVQRFRLVAIDTQDDGVAHLRGDFPESRSRIIPLRIVPQQIARPFSNTKCTRASAKSRICLFSRQSGV